MKNKWRFLKIFVTVILLGFLLSFSLKRFNNKTVGEKDIAINLQDSNTPVFFIEDQSIREIIKAQNPSRKVGEVSVPELEKKISSLPAVDSANVYINLDGKINIDVKQKVPVFRLNALEKTIYVDELGNSFPLHKNYAHPCMLVNGNILPEEYKKLITLVNKIQEDKFCENYFIGITKKMNNYYLLTPTGEFEVEFGDLDNIDFKIKGFKTFVEKYLAFQDPKKYKKISLKFNNQIVATLNPDYKN